MNYIKRIIIAAWLVTGMLSFFSLTTVQVAAETEAPGNCADTSDSFLGFPTWYKYLQVNPSDGCEITFEFPQDITKVLLALFEILLRVAGIVAVVFVVVGGFQYITSSGEPDRAKAARGTIINALVGLVIAAMATVIVNVVAGRLT